MAHKIAGGSTANGRKSLPKYLGVKLSDNQFVNKGSIIVLQRGLTFKPGKNVFLGKNFNLHALQNGFVKFRKKNGTVDVIVTN